MLLTVAGDQVKERSAELIEQMLAEVGVRVRVELQEMSTLLREYVYPRRFEAVLMALAPGADPDYLHAFYHSDMLTPVGWNRFSYKNAVVDQLLDRSRQALDFAERKRLIDKVQKLLIADPPHVFLFHPRVVDAAHRRLILPKLPSTPGNRFMYLHQWDIRD